MVGLTDRQKKALDLTKHISVTANAGSGKTRVLVERYVAAVGEGVDVEQILCLTFTEKAALELRQKIVDGINSGFFSRGSGGTADKRGGFMAQARRKMLEANISTIHAFCSQVLREFPVEAGIDANFKVLEDFDAASLKEDSCEEAVRGALVDERTPTPPASRIHDFLVRIGYKNVLSLLSDLLDNREKIEHIRAAGRPLILSAEKVSADWETVCRAGTTVVKEKFDLSKTKGLDESVRQIDEIARGESKNPIIDALKDLLSRILTKEGKLRAKVALRKESSPLREEEISLFELAYSSLKDFQPGERSLTGYLDMLAILLDLYERSESNYNRRKASIGALDFDDLQIFTMRLLRDNGTVREILTSRFSHIMVDEFQDTNFLQYDIFLRLLDNFSGGGKLFVVGDPKQSIYRFRNAQVEVSKRVSDDLGRIADGAGVPLAESFRMNPGLASFVNAVFPAVLEKATVFEKTGLPVPGQVDYEALVPRRPAGEPDPVEVFVIPRGQQVEDESDDESDAPDAGELQAMFVPARIRAMVDGNEKIRSAKDGEKPGNIRYGDIAILLRSRSRLPVLEEALTKYRIPFVVNAGLGFYSSQEIFDLTNYLTFLLDNNSDIDLLTVLRSPFFGISENELLAISTFKGDTLLERLRAHVASGSAAEEVKYALSVLEDEIALVHRLTIPELINRILERTGWLGAYALSPAGRQRLANLRKLLSIAREFEGRGFNNLYDFVERIKYLEKAAREGQAPVEESVDAVKVMTVHAAKGLEFPVVFLPFCDAATHRSRKLVVSDDVGILPDIAGEFPAELGLYRRLESVSEQAETARLFYVACTRAMDKLVLTWKTKKKPAGLKIGTFADIISRTFEVPESGDHAELAGVNVKIHRELPAVSIGAPDKAPSKQDKREMYLDAIPAMIDGEIYSATVLQTFALCPTKYFLRYRLGMPSSVVNDKLSMNNDSSPVPRLRPPDSAPQDDYTDAILSTVKGTIVHSVMQQILTSGSADTAAIASAAERAISANTSIGSEDRKRLLEEVSGNAVNAYETLSQIKSEGQLFVEQTVTRKFGADFLTGTLDLLIRDGNGFHIYDYKTNRLDRSPEEIYSEYEIQMKLYALLCGTLDPGQKEFDVTIIFTRERRKYLTKRFTAADLSKFESRIHVMIEGMKNLSSRPATDEKLLPTKTPHCPECDYFTGEKMKKCILGIGI